ncbi:hypothetical protein N9933_03635, partial [bacterium]|nr:hypothetical protein [bacterium]
MIRTLLFITFLTGIYSLYAVHSDLRFAHLGVKDGLPTRGGLCLLEDSDDFLWVGTPNGLARYNGIDFAEFSELAPGFQ